MNSSSTNRLESNRSTPRRLKQRHDSDDRWSLPSLAWLGRMKAQIANRLLKALGNSLPTGSVVGNVFEVTWGANTQNDAAAARPYGARGHGLEGPLQVT